MLDVDGEEGTFETEVEDEVADAVVFRVWDSDIEVDFAREEGTFGILDWRRWSRVWAIVDDDDGDASRVLALRVLVQ